MVVNSVILEGERTKVQLKIKTLGTFNEPKYELNAITKLSSEHLNTNFLYYFYRKIEDNNWINIANAINSNSYVDIPTINIPNDMTEYIIDYKVEIVININGPVIAGDILNVKRNKNIIEVNENNEEEENVENVEKEEDKENKGKEQNEKEKEKVKNKLINNKIKNI